MERARNNSRIETLFRGTPLAIVGSMSDLKREILVNDVLERAAALSYYLLFALVPAVLCVVWLA